MSATPKPVPSHQADPVRPFTWGAAGFILLGAGHLALTAAGELSEPTAQQQASSAAMRASTMTLLGLERSTFEIVHGMSLAMALFAIACGLLALTAVRHCPTLVQHRGAFGWIHLAASLVTLAIALVFLPAPPIIVLGMTSCAFALSAYRATKP